MSNAGTVQGYGTIACWNVSRADKYSVVFGNSNSLAVLNLSPFLRQRGDEYPQVVAKATTQADITSLSWGSLNNGIIAAGQKDGGMTIFEPSLTQPVAHMKKHVSSITCSEFSSVEKGVHLLASGSVTGQVLVSDLKRLTAPKTINPAVGLANDAKDSTTFVSWNSQVVHVLASGSSNGEVSVWDLRQKKLWCSVKGVKSNVVAKWNPKQGLYLMTSSENTLKLFDLRSSTVKPLTQFRGHTKSIVSFDWCMLDEMMAVSYGQDEKMLLWDLYSGLAVLDYNDLKGTSPLLEEKYPDEGVNAAQSGLAGLGLGQNQNANDVFDAFNEAAGENIAQSSKFVQFSTSAEGLILTNCLSDSGEPTVLTTNMFGAFNYQNKLQHGLQETIEPRPPKWFKQLQPPGFAFGNKLCYVSGGKAVIKQVPDEESSSLIAGLTEIDTMISKTITGESDFESYCAGMASQTDDMFTKYFFELLPVIAKNVEANRNDLTAFLGHSQQELKTTLYSRLGKPIEQASTEAEKPEETQTAPALKPQGMQGLQQLSSGTSNAADFFGNASSAATFDTPPPQEEENKGSEVLKSEIESNVISSKIEKVVTITEDTDVDEMVKKCLFLGEFEDGVNLLIENQRYADALLMSTCGGEDLWNSTVDAFLANNSEVPYLSLLKSVLNQDLSVYLEDNPTSIKNWKDQLVTICQYAKADEFHALCEKVGDKLIDLIKTAELTDLPELYKAGICCLLASGNIDKIVSCLIDYHGDVTADQSREERLVFLLHLSQKLLSLNLINEETFSSALSMQVLYKACVELANLGEFKLAARFLAEIQVFELNGDEDNFQTLNDLFFDIYILQDKIYTACPDKQFIGQFIPQKWFPYEVVQATNTILDTPEEDLQYEEETVQPQPTDQGYNQYDQQQYAPMQQENIYQPTGFSNQQTPGYNQGVQHTNQQQPASYAPTSNQQAPAHQFSYQQQPQTAYQEQSSYSNLQPPVAPPISKSPAAPVPPTQPQYTQNTTNPPTTNYTYQQADHYQYDNTAAPPTHLQQQPPGPPGMGYQVENKQLFQAVPQQKASSPTKVSPRIPLNDGFQSTVGDPSAGKKYGNLTTGNLVLDSKRERPRRRSSAASEVSNYDHHGNIIPGPNTQNAHVFDPAHPGTPAQTTTSAESKPTQPFVTQKLSAQMQQVLNSFHQLVKILEGFELRITEKKYLELGVNSLAILKEKLEGGKISNELQVELQEMASTIDNYDFNGANQLKLKITRHYWTQQKDWLKGFSQLITLAQKKYPGGQ